MILVSNTKYNGGSNPVPKLIELCQTGKIIPICPINATQTL